MENNTHDSNDMSFERVQNICYDIARKVCNEHQKDMEDSCQYKRESIMSRTDTKLGEISAGIGTLCSRFDEHLKLHEKSESFWKWFAVFICLIMGASNFIPKIIASGIKP